MTESYDNILSDTFDDDFLKPTDYAMAETIELLARLAGAHVSTAGDGGLRVEWQNGDRRVTLSLGPAKENRSYIYHQASFLIGDYGAEPVTVEGLTKWVNWIKAGSNE